MAEQYANSIRTTLDSAIGSGDTSLTVADATGMPATGDFRLRIGTELLICTSRTGATLTVTRGAESTTAASHSAGSAVTQVLTAAQVSALVVGPASAVDDRIATFDGTTGKLIQDSGVSVADLVASTVRTFGITIDGGGAEITTGAKGYVRVPFAGTITKVTVMADQVGDIVIDVWKDTLANYPPTNADSITASAPPTLSSESSSEDATLTGWTTTVSVGDVFGFNVDSVATVERVTVVIEVTP